MKFEVLFFSISVLSALHRNVPVQAAENAADMEKFGTVLLNVKNTLTEIDEPTQPDLKVPNKIENRLIRVGEDLEVKIELANFVLPPIPYSGLTHNIPTLSKIVFNVERASWIQKLSKGKGVGAGSGTIVVTAVKFKLRPCYVSFKSVNFELGLNFDLMVKGRENDFSKAFNAVLSNILCSLLKFKPIPVVPLEPLDVQNIVPVSAGASLFVNYTVQHMALFNVLLLGLAGYEGSSENTKALENLRSTPKSSDCLLPKDSSNDFSIAAATELVYSLILATPTETFRKTVDLSKNTDRLMTDEELQKQFPNLYLLMQLFRNQAKDKPGKLIYIVKPIAPPSLICYKTKVCAATTSLKSFVLYNPDDDTKQIEYKKYTTKISFKVLWDVAEDYDETTKFSYFKISGQHENLKVISNDYEVVFKSGDSDKGVFNDDLFQKEMIGKYLDKLFKSSFRMVHPYHKIKRATPTSFFTNETSGMHCIYGRYYKDPTIG